MDSIQLLKKYPVYQLKSILSQHNRNKKLGIKLISKQRKQDVINYLLHHKYNLNDLPNIKKLQAPTRNILKRFNTKVYTEDEQKEFLKKGYDIKNPLISKKEYFNKKSNKSEKIELLDHQKKFIRKFLLSNVPGAICYHGVGTGKTITAAVASHYYLSLYEDGNIIFISPPGLIINFVNALKDYGLNVEDKRYSFKSFEQFARNPTISNTKTLIIVDEAHQIRTYIQSSEQVDDKGKKSINVITNKRGYALVNACKKADKCIMLSGTPFINGLYDIENLLSCVDKKDPLNKNDYFQMITNTESRNDYFNYKISHYENNDSEFFPTKIEMFVPLVMTNAEENEYNQIDRGDDSVLENLDIILNVNSDKSLTSFYNGTRQFSDTLGNYKIDFIIDRIKKPQTTGQFIIYTQYVINGLNRIKKKLTANNITYATISGAESNDKKENSKNSYNNGEVNVLLITKSGTEGIDTINTEAVFIYEQAFNNSLVQQAIARACRYMSHYNLPKSQQKVFIYRLLTIKKTDADLINKINKNIIKNYSFINKKFMENSKQISLLKHEADINDDVNDYVVNNKNIPNDLSKSLKEKIDFEKSKYKSLSQEDKKKYLEQIKFNRYETDNKINQLFKSRPSVEARLTVMSLSKQEQIDEFISELDNKIQQLDDYETPYEIEINEIVLENLSDESILDIQKRYINEQTDDIFKLIKSDGKLSEILQNATNRAVRAKEKLDSVKRLQQFYTPEPVVRKMLDCSKLLKGFQKLNILEPSAGVGNICVEILKLRKENHVYMVEIDPKSREVLEQLVDTAPDVLTLYEQGNFLEFINPISYDVIIANPPFHLQKKYLSYLDKNDVYDCDFLIRCYYMLRDGGELLCLCRTENVNKPQYKKWLDDRDAELLEFSYKNWEDTKTKGEDGKIAKINLTIVILYRDINNIHDNKKLENTILELHEDKEELEHAKDAELYNASIDDNKYFHSITNDKNDVKYIKELKILKSEPNLMMYDVKNFLNKWKAEEYNNDSKYINKFIKQHKLNIVNQTNNYY